MDINLLALTFSVIVSLTFFVLVWCIEGFLIKRYARKEAAVSMSEKHIHVDIAHDTVATQEAVSKPIKEESDKHEQVIISMEQPTSEPSLNEPILECPECHSHKVVKRGFADKAHRKQRYLCRDCSVTFLRETKASP